MVIGDELRLSYQRPQTYIQEAANKSFTKRYTGLNPGSQRKKEKLK